MSSGFITETEIAEAKRVRQEEWEKVRNKEDPEEVRLNLDIPRNLFLLFCLLGSWARAWPSISVRQVAGAEIEERPGLWRDSQTGS